MQLLKAVLVTLVIASSLTSDTALRSTAATAQCSSTSWSNCVSITPTPKSLANQSWILPPLTLTSG